MLCWLVQLTLLADVVNGSIENSVGCPIAYLQNEKSAGPFGSALDGAHAISAIASLPVYDATQGEGEKKLSFRPARLAPRTTGEVDMPNAGDVFRQDPNAGSGIAMLKAPQETRGGFVMPAVVRRKSLLPEPKPTSIGPRLLLHKRPEPTLDSLGRRVALPHEVRAWAAAFEESRNRPPATHRGSRFVP